MNYLEMTRQQLENEFADVESQLKAYASKGFKFDMTRGKPGSEQLDLSYKLFNQVNTESNFFNEDNTDCRNYGGMDGISEVKNLFAEILQVPFENVIVGGNSSLNMMFDTISQGMVSGFSGEKPWLLQGKVKFICPSPGYDRHFAICEYFGIEMIPVAFLPDGPDMDEVEKLVADPAVKGIWVVPKYSNPGGAVCSDDVVRRMANLKPAAKDFRIFWDNAYAVHHLKTPGREILSLFDECVKAGNPDMFFTFASFSKITFPGASIAGMAASDANIKELKGRIAYQTIGPDKLNQLRHARMFKNIKDIEKHMEKHAQILRPKFKAVSDALENNLEGKGIAAWTDPDGGYFINLEVLPGCAKRTVEVCKSVGLVLTTAGAAYPYGNDPMDTTIRLAPTYPSLEDLRVASEILCVAVRYAALEMILKTK